MDSASNTSLLEQRVEQLVRDLAECRRFEQELLQEVEVLREQDRRKDEFLSTLAHELRNPLAALNAASQLLAKSAHKPDVATLARDALNRQVGHMVQLLDAALDIGRILQGRLQLSKQRMDVMEPIAAATESVKALLDARQQRLTVETPEHAVFIMGDPARLTQVVANLLTNAIKFSDAGAEIRVSVGNLAQDAVITVSDSGVGIAADDLPGIFEISPSKAAQRTSRNGLGIGLALVRGLIQLHGGRVSVQSHGLGQGSVFEVRVPVAEQVRSD